MKLSEFKNYLKNIETVNFQLESGAHVPSHFHVTEIGLIDKQFIDCGGTVRKEKAVNFQLWNANDLNHRLTPDKLLSIINVSEASLKLEDAEIEVEYQLNETVGKFGLEFSKGQFELTSRNTNCLASDHCGIPEAQLTVKKVKSCTPQSGCC